MIGFNAEVDNLSNRIMNRSTLQLVELVKYKVSVSFFLSIRIPNWKYCSGNKEDKIRTESCGRA